MRVYFAIVLAFLAWIAAGVESVAQAPPSPPPASVLGGNASLSVSNVSSRVALPVSTTTFPAVMLLNDGTTEIFFALGSNTVVATTSSAALPAGQSISLWSGNATNVAAITASSTSTLRVYQLNGAASLRSGGSASSGITSLTGDVTATGPGAAAATLAIAQPSAHTWAAAQTFTLAPVFTDASGSRTALGLGTAATQNTGTSGATIPLLSTANTWAGQQTFAGPTITGSFTATGLVTNAALANMANATTKCRTTAGTGAPEDCTATQIATILNSVGGVLKSRITSFTRDLSVASGSVSYTGIGFRPTSVIILGATTGTGFASIGLTDSGLTNTVLVAGFGLVGDFATNASFAIYINGDTTTNNYQTGAVTSFDADGFTISWTKGGTPTGIPTFYVLALR